MTTLLMVLSLLSGQVASAQSAYTGGNHEIIDLQYDQELSRLGFPNPLLKVSVHKHTVWFIVDTAASVHTFAKWFVKAAGLQMVETKSTVTGSTGVESKVSVVRNIPLHLNKQPREISIGDAIVVDFPQIFEEQRIAGLISPQLLAPQGSFVVLDLNVPQLGFSSVSPASTETQVCTNHRSQFTNRQAGS